MRWIIFCIVAGLCVFEFNRFAATLDHDTLNGLLAWMRYILLAAIVVAFTSYLASLIHREK